jgi:hypothetical protein
MMNPSGHPLDALLVCLLAGTFRATEAGFKAMNVALKQQAGLDCDAIALAFAHPLLWKAIDHADVQRIYILSPATLLQADLARFAESIKTQSKSVCCA